MMRIGRTYRFEAAHFLPKVPWGHKCKNMHGHNYRVEIVVSGDLDERGFVMDFAEIDEDIRPIIKTLDHRVLNNVIPNPTAENIAEYFRSHMTIKCERVRVYETDDCWAETTDESRCEISEFENVRIVRRKS